MKTTAILDADIFCYKVAQAAMHEVMFDEYVITIGDSAEAKVALDNWIDKVAEQIGADKVELAFTGKNNFRKELWPEYKAHRVKKSLMLFSELRAYCDKVYKVICDDKLEADDLLGQRMSWSYMDKKGNHLYVGVSEDKDMQAIPGAIFNPAKDTIVQHNSLNEATYNFYIQTLIGDPADNYKGCPGIGETKAHKYLQRLIAEISTDSGHYDYHEFVKEGWNLILECFDKSGLDEQDAITNASMAKLLWYKEEPGWFTTDKLLNYWSIVHGK